MAFPGASFFLIPVRYFAQFASVLLPDKPGELVKVAKIIADANGNVIKLDHNQFVSINRKATVELRITIEAFGHEHKEQIVSELEKNGLRPRLVKVNI